jgi:hypothetical protein
MCFSPEADLIGGALITGIGIDALLHVKRRKRYLPLAALPVIFGFHQLVESVVWFGLQGHVDHFFTHLATTVYLAIAMVFLPIYVPLAVLMVEPSKKRRYAMIPFCLMGIFVGVILAHSMIQGHYGATAEPYHVAYHLGLRDSLSLVAAYVAAVCGALLLSGQRHVVIFGVVNLIAVLVIAKLTVDGFASVWCGWAAVTSGAVALHIRISHPDFTAETSESIRLSPS